MYYSPRLRLVTGVMTLVHFAYVERRTLRHRQTRHDGYIVVSQAVTVLLLCSPSKTAGTGTRTHMTDPRDRQVQE